MNYLLVGTESYNLRKRRDDIILKQVGSLDDELACSLYHGQEDIDFIEVINDCQTIPFLSEHKVVVIENPLFLLENKMEDNDLKVLTDYLNNPNESTTLIICYDGNIAKNSALLKKLSQYMIYETFEPLTSEQFASYVRKDLQDNQLNLDEQAIKELLDRLPLSIDNFKQELEKLKLYPNEITLSVIKDLVSKPIEDNVFELTNAVINKDMAKAINVLNDLLMDKSRDVLSLVGLLASQFRFMSQVKILQENGYDNNQIAQRLQAKNYRIVMTLKNCNGKSSQDILSILNQLSVLDQQLKTSRYNPISALELFIIKTIRS